MRIRVTYKRQVEADRFDWDKGATPSAPLPFPTSLILWMGRVTLAWTLFEQSLEVTIARLLEQSEAPQPPRWETWSFAQKQKLCSKLIKQVIWEGNGLHQALLDLLAEAGELAWRRNSLVHARLRGPVPAFGSTPFGVEPQTQFHGEAQRRGEAFEFRCDEPGLERLFYRISHLSGVLMYLDSVQDGIPRLVEQDIAARVADAEDTWR